MGHGWHSGKDLPDRQIFFLELERHITKTLLKRRCRGASCAAMMCVTTHSKPEQTATHTTSSKL